MTMLVALAPFDSGYQLRVSDHLTVALEGDTPVAYGWLEYGFTDAHSTVLTWQGSVGALGLFAGEAPENWMLVGRGSLATVTVERVGESLSRTAYYDD
ncbi:MAG: hypothetical protein AAF916_11155 [Planctomycetota bacterium]